MVWPDKVRPEASVMVTESMTGRRAGRSSNRFSIANRPPWRSGVENRFEQNDLGASFDQGFRLFVIGGDQLRRK